MRVWIRVLQGFSVILALILIASFVLAIMRRMPWITFWILLAIIAFVAYVVLPRVTKIIGKY